MKTHLGERKKKHSKLWKKSVCVFSCDLWFRNPLNLKTNCPKNYSPKIHCWTLNEVWLVSEALCSSGRPWTCDSGLSLLSCWMLGLCCHSHINLISFCHHFPGVPAKSFTVKTEVKLSVCRGHNTSCGKCQDLHGKKILELINNFRHSVGPEHDVSAFWFGPLLCFHFYSLESIS